MSKNTISEVEKSKLMESSYLFFGDQIEQRYVEWLRSRNPQAAAREEERLQMRRNSISWGGSGRGHASASHPSGSYLPYRPYLELDWA